MKKYSTALSLILLLFFFQCCHSQKETIQYSTGKYAYEYDTVARTYHGDFTKNYTGGIDLLFLDSTLFVAYNYCGDNTIKIVNHFNDSVLILPQFNPECQVIYTSMKTDGIYVTTTENKIYLHCNGRAEKGLIADLMSNEKFKQSGLAVEWHKPGGDQYVDIPEDVLYFRVRQDLEDTGGKYSKMDYGFPAFARLNLISQEIDFYGNKPRFAEYDEYGLLSMHFDLFIGDSIITSTPVNGEIQIINTHSNQTIKKNIKSQYDNVPIKKFRYKKEIKDVNNLKMKHALLSARYEPLFYNPFNMCFYRIFHPAMEELNDEGLLNTEFDKKCILMVFKKNWNL